MDKVNSRALKRMTGSDLLALKRKYADANIICPILQVVLDRDSAVVDHKHITKGDIKKGKTGEDGKGLLRGVIHDQANVFIGKIEKGFVRSGCHKFDLSISDQLRLIAAYLEDPPLPQNMIHPNERIKPKTLTKRDYKKICKYWSEMFPGKRVPPKYPKKNKHNLTPRWVTYIHMAEECSVSKKKRKVKRIK